MIFVIADLHLSLSTDKPMDIFGEGWENHHEKIKADWIKKVGEGDLVILPGDISWSMRLEDALTDFAWIDNLPGTKVITKGNHDYWWNHKGKLESRFSSIFFVSSNHFIYGDKAICGTRLWDLPSPKFTEDDHKIFNRELIRLENSLSSVPRGIDIIASVHYPPMYSPDQTLITDIFEKYSVSKVFYGHLHDRYSQAAAFKGVLNGIEYILTAADYAGFKLTLADFGSGEDLGDVSPSERKMLNKRLQLIYRLTQGEIEKDEFIEANYEMAMEYKPSTGRITGLADGILRYQYFNALAKKQMLDADLYEFRDLEKCLKIREGAYEYYRFKEQAASEMVDLMFDLGRQQEIECYKIEMNSEFLNGRLFEITMLPGERVVMHSMDDGLFSRLKAAGLADKSPRVSKIQGYVNKRIGR